MGRAKMSSKSKKVSPKAKDEELGDDVEMEEHKNGNGAANGRDKKKTAASKMGRSKGKVKSANKVTPKVAALKQTGRPQRAAVTKAKKVMNLMNAKCDESDEDDDEEDYEVEQILGLKFVKNKNSFLVKWKGYSQTTWEPEANLQNSKALLSAFKAKLRNV